MQRVMMLFSLYAITPFGQAALAFSAFCGPPVVAGATITIWLATLGTIMGFIKWPD